MIKAVGYIRVSTEDQAENGVSLDNQKQRIKEYCDYKGFELTEIIEDAGISGGKNKSRPGFNGIMDTVESTEIDIVVLYSLERLSRDMLTMLALERFLNEYDVKLHTVDGAINTDTPDGFMGFAMKAFMGEMERRQVKYRTKNSMKHIKDNGYAIGNIPYGYSYEIEKVIVRFKGKEVEKDKRKLVDNKEEQEIIQMVRKMYSDGIGLTKISRILEGSGKVSREGKKFNTTQIRMMLKEYKPGWKRTRGTIAKTIRDFINAIG